MSHSIEIRIVNVSILGFYSLDLERGGGGAVPSCD